MIVVSSLLLFTNSMYAQEPLKKLTGSTHVEVPNDEEKFGTALKGTYDFNNDGYNDLLVGAPSHDYPASGTDQYPGAGAAYIYYGALDGASLTELRLEFPKVDLQFEKFGSDVAFVESFNDGSVADAIVSAPGYGSNGVGGIHDFGRVFVYYGGSNPDSSVSVTLKAPTEIELAWFGASVATAGAFDNDSYHDIVVGAPMFGPTTSYAGKVYVFLGSNSPTPTEYPDVIYGGESEDDHFGESVDGGKDFAGDSYADIIVGAPGYDSGTDIGIGRAYVLAGHTRQTPPETLSAATDAHATITGENAGNQFGMAVAIIGDVNGDGTADIAVAAPSYKVGISTRGAVYIFLGGSSLSGSLLASEASMRIIGPGTHFGEEISAAGDLNADGFDDFIVSNARDETDTGQALVFYGGDRFQPYSAPTLVSKDYSELAVDLYVGEDTYDLLGTGLAAVGDINSDGLDDVAVGAPGFDEDNETAGAFFIYDSALNLSDVSSTSSLGFSGKTPYASANIDFDAGVSSNKGQDLILTFDDESGQIYRNGGVSGSQLTLSNDTALVFDASESPDSGSKGIAVADYDNDGRMDAFVAHGSTPRLYRGILNGSQGELDDIAGSKISGADKSVAAAWGDYDRDGHLDLYVVRATGTPTPAGAVAQQDRLFHSDVVNENGFDDVTSDSGIGLKTTSTKTIAASWADVDQDGNLDLYVASIDAGGATGEYGTFYYNKGGGEFEDRTAAASGPAIGNIAYSTGITWADLDRDGDLDLVLSRVDPGASANNIWTCENDGNGRFSMEQIGGIEVSDPMNGVMAVDYDLNGFVDLIGAPEDADQAPLLAGYESTGGVSYLERGERIGLSAKAAGGLSIYDHDEDGDLEAFLGRTYTGTAAEVLYEAGRNSEHSTPAATWLGIKLSTPEISGNNRYGIGALIKATVPATGTPKFEIVSEMGSAAGRGGQDQLVQYFGFGELQDDVLITVTWPDGYEQTETYDAETGLDSVVTIIETLHAPAIVTKSLELIFQPLPGEKVDWLIQWESLCNSDPASLQVTVDAGTRNGPSCFDPEGPITLTASTANVETSVTPLANGNYLNQIRWKNRTCTAVCKYIAYDPECAMGTMVSSSADADETSLPACLQ